MKPMNCDPRCMLRMLAAASLAGAVLLSSARAAPASEDAEAQAQDSWRENIARTDVPGEGCFYAAYPSVEWTKVGCTEAPRLPFIPRRGTVGNTVGNGVDYAARVSGLITRSVGTFPKVTGVASETGLMGTNDYSLQLNSNFMSTAACKGHTGCQSWQQFVYASGYGVAFMQYWLINYGACPSGWYTYSPDCYKNSVGVSVPDEAITGLHGLKLSGRAVAAGRDTLVFTAGTIAYSTAGKDSVVDLATDWHESEFNVIGDGNGSKAVFNTGSSVKVKIAVTDGSTLAPTCASNSGTTGETNNLNLKSCSGYGGTTPYIAFVESN